jgi:hypothetical protein
MKHGCAALFFEPIKTPNFKENRKQAHDYLPMLKALSVAEFSFKILHCFFQSIIKLEGRFVSQ